MNRIQSESRPSYPRLLSLVAILCILSAVIVGCEFGDKTDGKPDVTITLEPTSATLTAFTMGSVDFEATGGVGTYTWSVSNTRLGIIYSAGATSTYQSKTNSNSIGVNVITVSDQDGNTAQATVSQQ